MCRQPKRHVDTSNHILVVISRRVPPIVVHQALDEQYKEKGEKKNVRIAALNSRVFDDIPEQWGVTGYPWVTAFYDGKKVADMAGLGGAQSVIDWANRMVAEHWKPENGEPQVHLQTTLKTY